MFEELESERVGVYADVILPLPIHGSFTYRIAEEDTTVAKVGARVLVPFGKGKMFTGIIEKIHSQIPGTFHIHFIQELLDKEKVLISPELIENWRWIAKYYMCPLGEVYNACMPAGLNFHSLTYVEINPEIYWPDENLTPTESKIMTIVEHKKKLTVKELEKEMRSRTSLLKSIKDLYLRDLLLISEDIQQAYKPKTETYLMVSETFKNEKFAREQIEILQRKAPKQYELLLTLFGYPGRVAKLKTLEQEKGISPATIQALRKKKLIVQEKREVSRISQSELNNKIPNLTDFQAKAKEYIESHWKKNPVVLLQAPTGGGKTLIYTHLIQEALEQNKQVLMLVPEIALTAQLVERMQLYFADKLMVTHSKFGMNNRTEVWLRINSGEAALVIGPRSAALLPYKNLGLIIIDEEHETTFKQFDKMPRFNGKDLAIKNGVDRGAKILVASATPCLDSLYNTRFRNWGLVSYTQRFGGAAPAQIDLVNISSSRKRQGVKTFLTHELDEAIRKNISAGKQVLLFQNKKGYVPMIECGLCEWTPKCISCDISLTYYKYSNDLRCHYCGYKQPVVVKCGACGSNDMRMWGYGTERIMEETRLRYPDMQVRRFDQDAARGKDAHSKIIHDFEEGKTQVLVGTQLIVKGIDFSNVGLCAVISADQMLHFPDFRASERTFQLLTQLAGRAGRRDGEGHMLIQTGQPENPVFEFIKNYDYEGFCEKELQIRKDLNYPPFSKLIRITVEHKDSRICAEAATLFANILKKSLQGKALGPEQPFVARIKNYYLQNILVKLNSGTDPIPKIKDWLVTQSQALTSVDAFKSVRISFDVDPM